MDNLIFKNLDTLASIEVDLTKPLTVIYGGNGTGKTTLSRSFQSETSAVFNSDFINKNVYIIDSDGAKTDSGTKEKISSIFLGEDAVNLAKSVVKLKEDEKQCQKIRDESTLLINNQLSNSGLKTYANFDDLLKKVSFDFTYDVEKTVDENKKSFVIKKVLNTDISTETEFESANSKLKSNNITQVLRDKVNADFFIKKVLESDFFSVEDLLSEYNEMYVEINDIEKVFSIHGESSKIKKWIRDGIELHSAKTDCIFCSNQNIKSNIKNWREHLESKNIELKKDLIDTIEKYIASIGIILRDRELFNSIAPNIMSSFNNINLHLQKVKEGITCNQFVVPERIDVLKDDIYKSEDKLVEDLTNYIVNKSLDSILYHLAIFRDLKTNIKLKEEESKEKNRRYADEIANTINCYSKILGFNKDIRITSDNRGGQPKINLEADDKTGKISNYSEGQRHKLALAIFFSMFDKHNENFDFVVLDDPVISLDVFGYHSLKCLLKSFGKKYQNKKLVILTHNIHYLLIQVSNFLDNGENINIFELTSTATKEIPTDILKLDDISLFKVSLNNIVDMNDLTLKYWLCQKIFRNFLDLRLRFLGKSSFSNPKHDICELDNLNQDDKVKLQIISNEICKTCRKRVATVSDIIILFNNLNNALQMLNFPKIIDDSNFKSLGKFDISDKTIENPKPTGLLQEILHFAYSLEFIETPDSFEEELLNYLNHPRHQFTESLIAIKGKKDV